MLQTCFAKRSNSALCGPDLIDVQASSRKSPAVRFGCRKPLWLSRSKRDAGGFLGPTDVEQVCNIGVEYEIRFEASWSGSTHPSAYPNFAHFSPLIGATHDAATHLWENQGSATQGIESMAESGSTSNLVGEINALMVQGAAGQVINGAGIVSPGATSTTFTATTTHSFFSLVTMIAPSPDWFIGVDGVSLLESEQWIDSVSIDLFAWDAGTDSGLGFNSSNSNTNPQDPIQLMTGGPFFGTTKLGTLHVTLTVGATYCTAKPNSLGCDPSISSVGSASMTSGMPFRIEAQNVINQKNGLLFYGLNSNSAPFQGGTLCIGGALVRTQVQNSSGNTGTSDCSGSYSFDMGSYIQAATDPNLTPGTTVFTQYWSRDPQSEAD
jgi:hypothetical protein